MLMRRNLGWGVLGSAFDPPTWGHWDVVEQVAPWVEGIFLVPSFAHAFAKTMQPFAHRVAMLQRWAHSRRAPVPLKVCTIEALVAARGACDAVYTYHMMRALQARYPKLALCFIRGPDNARPEVWQRFFRYQEIERQWALWTAQQRVPVRSSQVRALCQQAPVTLSALQGLVPDSVAHYMMEHGLYQRV